MTECNQNEFVFAPHFSRQVSARFSERQLSTEGGALLLRETDRKIGLLSRARKCFSDHRHPVWVVHELSELLAQRIYGLALGYEDLNDHAELRRDPLLAVLAGKRKLEEPLAGKSTLNRLELTPAGSPLNDRYHKITYSREALDGLLVDIFLEAHAKAPRQIVLDLDVTDTPLYGQQEDCFFHGYYNEYCYLPLYIFCGDHLLLDSREMGIRYLVPVCIVLSVLGGASLAFADSPNVVLITLDTVRADRMGFLGSARGLTPNLDSLSKQSVIFEHAYSQAPVTTASHATILTGTYPQFHRVSDFGSRLPSRIPDLAELFKQHGYRTAAFVGSIILDPQNGLAPGFDRGFDVYDAGFRLRRPGEDRYQTVERRADEVVARATRWVEENAGHPFFLWIHLYDAHQPYDPPEEYAKRFPAQPYDGEIAYIDAALGKLLASLRKKGMDKPSIVAVMADHGEALGQHGEEGHGIFLYDETICVPLLIKFPAERFAGKRVQGRARLVDVAPTLLASAELPLPADMQGESLLDCVDTRAADRPTYSETDYPQQGFGWSKLWSLRDGKYLFVDAPRRELYDTVADPQAKTNIAGEHEAVLATLAARLEQMRRRYRSELVPQKQGASLSASQNEALAALGYVAQSPIAEKTTPIGADPKDNILVANQLQDAMLLLDTDHPDKAIPLLQQVVIKVPGIYLAQFELGRAQSRLRNYAAAEAALSKATELIPESALAHYELGLVVFENGNARVAATHFEKAVSLAPEMADAHFSLAAVYARIDRLSDAVRELNDTLKLNSKHYRANLLLGRILFLQGHSADARPYLEEAVAVQPGSKEAHTFLADAYGQLGMESESKRERDKAESLQPAHP